MQHPDNHTVDTAAVFWEWKSISQIFLLTDNWKEARQVSFMRTKQKYLRVCSTHACVCMNVHVLQTQALFLLQHWHQLMFSRPSVTTVLSHFLGFLERSPPKGPSLSTGPSMCSEAESTQRWWRWKMWKMEQVCICPAALPLETVYMFIHGTLLGNFSNLLWVSGYSWCNVL